MLWHKYTKRKGTMQELFNNYTGTLPEVLPFQVMPQLQAETKPAFLKKPGLCT
jgi:hypothetical protein